MAERESLPWLLWDLHKTNRQGLEAIKHRQCGRLAEMVAYARAGSPYYRELYHGLPERIEEPSLLPVTNKKQLMARFNDWCVDRQVTLAKVRAFVRNRKLIGDWFLGKYTVLTTSGTTGTPGIFVLDDRSMAVTSAIALRMLGAWLRLPDVLRIIARGGRISMVMATGGHFASAVAAARMLKYRGKRIQVLSVHAPLPELVSELDTFRPAVVAAYASAAAMLASEQEAGRLHIEPVLMALAAEGLPAGEYDRIARAFNTKVGNSYAATECPFLGHSCPHGWLHVNSDWVVFEGVDADYNPIPPGQPSHTVLISNLANQVQPILRYDLGDSILVRPDPCPCGNPFPAIRVQGRSGEVLALLNDRGEKVGIPPLAFSNVADQTPAIERFQIVQTTPISLRVRILPAAGADVESVWRAVLADIARMLGRHALIRITVERGEEPPEQSPGGKYRQVIPLA